MLTQMTPIEHFKELVNTAIRNQRIKADEIVEFYLSSLLAGYVTGENVSREPLAITYFKALESDRSVQGRLFKELGDFSLFISGFFSDSLGRKLVDVGYYVRMGVVSYASLASIHRGDSAAALRALFSELSERFTLFSDVLAEVGERCRLSNSKDILRLYERWLRTKSRRSERILRDLGIEPMEISTMPIQ